ncbi:MAG: glutamate-1-semialdehyde 2,1-aminomutase [Pirellula sp.]
MQFLRSKQIQARAHELIPGGSHSYAKGADHYPELSPGFIVRGLGSHVWDADGNEFIEYSQGNRSVALGHAFAPVLKAVHRELAHGANFTRPSVVEVEAAEVFLELISNAEMVKFCKDGSDATTAALKLARAHTGRDFVACCRDQPFFASNDWFIGTTPLNAGIPTRVQELTLTFGYGSLDNVQKLFDEHPNQIAGLIMEPAKYQDPPPGYLNAVRELCHRNGTLFILDEMITGFRWHQGGGQAYYGVDADLSCWGKALANGFSVSALAGKRQYMELGGLRHSGQRVFLLSTTHGAETHSLAAAIATIQTYQNEPVIETIYERGSRLLHEGTQLIQRHGLEQHVRIDGKPCCLVVSTLDRNGEPSQSMRSLFLQETIKRGILMNSLVVSYSHSNEDIDRTLEAMDGALAVYRNALENGVENYLVGAPSQSVFRRYNFPNNLGR